jgi:hypothetical protein
LRGGAARLLQRGTTRTLYAVRGKLITLAAGSVCLPATYTLTRDGSYELSVGIIITIAAFAAWAALSYTRRGDEGVSWWSLASAFTVGALLSETLFFAHYYFDYGHADAKLNVGIALLIIEGGLIALLGAAAVVGAFFAFRRITAASRATR